MTQENLKSEFEAYLYDENKLNIAASFLSCLDSDSEQYAQQLERCVLIEKKLQKQVACASVSMHITEEQFVDLLNEYQNSKIK